jgi:hypothetical protein
MQNAAPIAALLLLAGAAAPIQTQTPANARYTMAPTELRVSARTHNPFSAESHTTITRLQVTRTIDNNIARDSYGRTYSEEHLPANSGDGVARYPYRVTDVKSGKVLYINSAFHSVTTMPITGRLDYRPPARLPDDYLTPVYSAIGESYRVHTEALGEKLIDGHECAGMRTSYTNLPGTPNHKRIYEVWYAVDLDADVLVIEHREDPEIYDQRTEMTSVVMGDPDPSLFTVPPGFTVAPAQVRH